MKTAFVIVLLCTLFVACAAQQEQWPSRSPLSTLVDNPKQAIEQQLEPYLKEFMQAWNLPGLAIGVVSDREILYANAFGEANITFHTPLTTRSLLFPGSITKVFNATAVMQLVEQGKLNLDEPVVTYLPYFQIDDPRHTQITVRHLLTHTSGIGATLDGGVQDYTADNKEANDPEVAKRFISHFKYRQIMLDAEPGVLYEYSNIGHIILGEVIANASGMPYETYMQEQIFTPLGMSDTTLFPESVPLELDVAGYEFGDSLVEIPNRYVRRAVAAGTGLRSNVLDMCRWLMAQLNRGELDGKRILQSSSYDQLWQPLVRVNRSGYYQGLGWQMIRFQEGSQRIFHEGAVLGFNALLQLFPQDAYGMVILVNATGVDLMAIVDAVEAFLYGTPVPEITLPDKET